MQKSKTSNTLKSTLMLLLAGLLLPLLWPGMFKNLLKTAGFETGHDHNWPNSLVVLHVGSDLLTFLAYTAIAFTLGVLVFQNRKQIPFHRILLSFGLFIVACGLTHLMHVVTRYSPVYHLDAYIRAVTAIVSVITAVVLPPMLPRVRSLLEAQQALRHKKLELERSRQALEDHNRELQQAHLDMLEARDHTEFHASLGDLLQTVHDPDSLADQALEKLGPALKAEQVTLIRIQQGRAKLWHAWGDFKPSLIAFLMGEGTPLEELVVLRNVVQTGQRYYTQHYSEIEGARTVSEHRISAAFEPIVKASGEVVAVIAFSRSFDLPWTQQEQVLAARAASTLALALERTELQVALHAREQALLEAQQNAPLAEVVMDLTGRPLRVNPASCRILGYSESDLLNMTLQQVIHPEELEVTLHHIRQVVSGELRTVEQDRRCFHQDGTVIWLHVHLSVIYSVDGEPLQLILQFSDITQRKLVEQEKDRARRYIEAERQVSGLLEQSLSPVEMAQEASRILSAFIEMDFSSLMEVQEDVGRVIPLPQTPRAIEAFEGRTPSPVPRGQSLAWQCLLQDQPLYIEDYQERPNTNPFFQQVGTTAAVFLPLVPLSSKRTPPLVFMGSWLNGKTQITEDDRRLLDSAGRCIRIAVERQEHLQELQEAALTDALTGLGNRRAFEEDLRQAHARATRHLQPFGVMVLDLDGLKATNDLMGHEAGDRLLRLTGTLLKEHMRAEDRCYCLGGDEFAVLLSHCSLESSEVLNERIETVVQCVQAAGFAETNLSVGMAFHPQEGTDSEDLLRLADQRMYQMKEAHHRHPS